MKANSIFATLSMPVLIASLVACTSDVGQVATTPPFATEIQISKNLHSSSNCPQASKWREIKTDPQHITSDVVSGVTFLGNKGAKVLEVMPRKTALEDGVVLRERDESLVTGTIGYRDRVITGRPKAEGDRAGVGSCQSGFVEWKNIRAEKRLKMTTYAFTKDTLTITTHDYTLSGPDSTTTVVMAPTNEDFNWRTK